MQLVRRAYAKLNLALSVGPPEPTSGMHPIASWMHAVDLYDTVEITEENSGGEARFECVWAPDAPRRSPIDWPPEKDLAFRALQQVREAAPDLPPVSIRIEKRIPVGGGLGGGSSDAAAIYTGLNELFKLGFTGEQLLTMSRSLGSDIAYFLGETPPPPAIVRGLGNQIERLPRTTAGRPVILIVPTFGCPTGPVYKAYDALGPRPLREAEVRAMVRPKGLSELPPLNDLLAPAEMIQPALRPLCEAIKNLCSLPVHMSGSGSTLFILPPSEPEEVSHLATPLSAPLAAKIAGERTDISVLTTRLV